VALAADGNTGLIGGPGDHGHGTEGVGAAWVFTRTGSTWSQQGPKLTGAGEVGLGEAGWSVALAADGDTALIGAAHDNGRHEEGPGAAWIFTRTGSVWSQDSGKLTGDGEVGNGAFGLSAAMSADANTALIGAPLDNGDVGAAWVFVP
jgi:hypothetical protein